jgi:hypothetical protein
MTKLSDEELQLLKDKFLNKKISVIDGNGEKWVGECQFLGYNSFIKTWGLQVTLNRTPVTHVDPKSIKLFVG